MKEIEVKARLSDPQTLAQKVEALGCVWSEPVIQDDTVYAKHVGSLEIFCANEAFLRLRVKNGEKIIFTVKKPVQNDLDALEYEIEVPSREKMEEILRALGYQEAVRIRKTRRTTHYQGCEICLDEVANLGSFMEIEKLTDQADGEKVQAELFAFLQTLGIKAEDRVLTGYDVLLLGGDPTKNHRRPEAV